MAASHCFARVFGVGEDVGAVSSQAQAYGYYEYGRAYDHVTSLLLLDVEDELHQPHYSDEHEVVVEHLRVLCGARGYEYHCQDGAQYVFLLAEDKVERSQHHGRVGYGPGLRYMSGAYYHQEVRRQPYGNGPRYAEPFVHVETSQAYEEAQEIHENYPGGVVRFVEKPEDGADEAF